MPRLLGRGCDPARAAYAKATWEPLLGVTIDVATTDAMLKMYCEQHSYDLFFLAPGFLSLCASDRDMMAQVKALVVSTQGNIPIVEIARVEDAIPRLAAALVKDIPANTHWPFRD